MTDVELIEKTKKLIITKLNNSNCCEINHAETGTIFFISTYDEGLSYHLYEGCDLIVGDVSLTHVATILCDFHKRTTSISSTNAILNRSIESIDDVKSRLLSDDKFLCSALLKLYNCQTKDEQSFYQTRVKNNIGFNAVDSRILTSIAQSFEKYHNLTSRQLSLVRSKLPKYAKQIFNLL